MSWRGILAGLVVFLAVQSGASAADLLGAWVGPGGKPTLSLKADGSLVFNGQAFRYQAQGAMLYVQSPEGVEVYQYQLAGDRLTVAGGSLGVVKMTRQEAIGAPSVLPSSPSARTVVPASVAAPGSGRAPPAPPAPAAPGEFLAAAYGFRMTPGKEWRWALKEEGVVFGHPSVPGAVLALVYDEPLTEAEIEKVARQGYKDNAGTDLKPKTPGVVQKVATGQGKGSFFRVTGQLEGSPVAGFLGAYLPPGSQPILVLAVTTPEKLTTLEPHARRMLASVRLFPGHSPEVRRWEDALRSYKVTHRWSHYSGNAVGGGYGSAEINKEWHLCADGTYWYQGSSHTHIDTGNDYANGASGAWGLASSGGKGSEQGAWRVVPHGEGTAILFRPFSGGAYRYRLHKQRKRGSSYMQTHFGDMGVYAADAADCR